MKVILCYYSFMSDLPAFCSIRQLAVLMREHHVTRCVICPGSRNSPLAHMLTQTGFECRSAYDERSAGFLALGWASQSKSAVAVIVTSGSALLNLHPAVAEAHYRQIPLLVISADRPAAWIGQQDGQTLPQQGVFSSLVRISTQLPEDSEKESSETTWHRNRLINEALLALTHRTAAPVHINIPLGEPLWATSPSPLPRQRVIGRTEFARMNADAEDMLIHQARELPRRMILLGQNSLPPQLYRELHDKGFVIIGDSISNAHQHLAAISQVDLILGARPDASWSPDLLISCGGHIVSKRFKSYLRSHPPRAHWHVSADGALIDTFCCLSQCIEGSEDELWDLLINFLPDMEAEDASAQYHALWYQGDARLKIPNFDALPYSGLRLIGEFIACMPSPATLHLANSLSIRLAQLCEIPSGVQVESNRGVNGIEGSLSTAIGYAQGESTRPNYLIIGDLSFFYDMNALSLSPAPRNLRILLINNGGGALFKALPKRPIIDESEPFIVASHQLVAQGWASSTSYDYRRINSIEDWQQHLPALLAPIEQQQAPLIIEVITEAEDDVAAFKQFFQLSHF